MSSYFAYAIKFLIFQPPSWMHLLILCTHTIEYMFINMFTYRMGIFSFAPAENCVLFALDLSPHATCCRQWLVFYGEMCSEQHRRLCSNNTIDVFIATIRYDGGDVWWLCIIMNDRDYKRILFYFIQRCFCTFVFLLIFGNEELRLCVKILVSAIIIFLWFSLIIEFSYLPELQGLAD